MVNGNQAQHGAVIIVVLVLLTVMSMFGLSAMRGGIVQVKIAQNGYVFSQVDQAADASIECELSDIVDLGVLDYVEKRLGPRLALDVLDGQDAIDGCSVERTLIPVKQHGFNGVHATTYSEYCGKRAPQIAATDVEFFQAHHYQTTGQGYFPAPVRVSVGLQQSWQVLLPNDSQGLALVFEQLQDGEGEPLEQPRLVNHQSQCDDAVLGSASHSDSEATTPGRSG